MPDEAFEVLWKVPGGKDLVGMHALLGGGAVPADLLRELLKLTREQFRMACSAAASLGLLEEEDERIVFLLFSKDSGQQARLEWCLEPHQDEFPSVLGRLKSELLLRFLQAKPGEAN